MVLFISSRKLPMLLRSPSSARLLLFCSLLLPTWHDFRRDDEGDPGDDDEEAARQVRLQQHRRPTPDQVDLQEEKNKRVDYVLTAPYG